MESNELEQEQILKSLLAIKGRLLCCRKWFADDDLLYLDKAIELFDLVHNEYMKFTSNGIQNWITGVEEMVSDFETRARLIQLKQNA